MAERTLDNELYDNHGEIELGGSANAYTATTARAITGYYKGLRISGKANHTNTGAATLNVNGLGAVAIRKNASTALVAGDIVSGQYYDFPYDATNGWFQLMNPSTGTIPDGSVGTTQLADDSVTNAKLANMAQSTIKGRAVGAGTGDPTDLTSAQATAILDAFTSALKGLVPASGGGTTTFLRADATFAAPTQIVNAVAQGAVSAAATLSISLGSADMYEIDLINMIPATDGASPWLLVSQSGSYLTGASDYRWARQTAGTGEVDTADTEIELSADVGNVSPEMCGFKVRFYRPSASSFYKTFIWEGFKVNGSGLYQQVAGTGQLILNTNAIDAVRFQFSSGNIASGYYAVRSYSFT